MKTRLHDTESLPAKKGRLHGKRSRRILVELHAYIGAGQSGAAHNKLAEIMAMTAAKAPRPASSPKYRETFAISLAMEQWRETHSDD